jgi:hypothetical protein
MKISLRIAALPLLLADFYLLGAPDQKDVGQEEVMN